MQAIKEVPGDITKRRFGKRVKDRGTDCLKRLRASLYPVPQPLSNRFCAAAATAPAAAKWRLRRFLPAGPQAGAAGPGAGPAGPRRAITPAWFFRQPSGIRPEAAQICRKACGAITMGLFATYLITIMETSQ